MKALFAFALGMLLAFPASAQPPDKPNEFSLGIGDAGFIFIIEDAATVVFTLGTVTYGDQRGGFQVVAGYQRWLNSWASAGLTGSWAGSKKTMYFMGDEVDKVERRLLTLMADGRAHWLRRPRVELYSGIAIGAMSLGDDWVTAPQKDDLNGVSFHVIPIGVRFGGDVGGYFQTGAGFLGFLKAGISVRR